MDLLEIMSMVDIVEYIKNFCDLEERGGEWWGLSPFKEEKTPSFSVNEEKQRFYDFSTGFGGNIIDFIKRYYDCDFYDALTKLKEYAGVSDKDCSINIPKRLTSTKIAKKFRKTGEKSKESKVKPLENNYMQQYEDRDDKLKVWRDEGISDDSMKKFSVKYDSFANRIVFPIRSYTGEIINVCGRTLDDQFKEKGLRKYTYYKPWGYLDTLYGYFENKEEIENKKEIIIFEGAKSVMIADDWGIRNTCAILTSHLNPHQMMFLIKLGCRVVFALDEEVNIFEDVNIQRLKRYVSVEWVKNIDGLLSSKMAPIDAGKDTWNILYNRRIAIN